jgi:hypothetical protein
VGVLLEVGIERVQPARPHVAERLQPFADPLKRKWLQAIDPLLPPLVDCHQTGLFEDPQMPRYLRLADFERGHDLADWSWPTPQQLHDPEAVGFSDGQELILKSGDTHRASMYYNVYTCQDIYALCLDLSDGDVASRREAVGKCGAAGSLFTRRIRWGSRLPARTYP